MKKETDSSIYKAEYDLACRILDDNRQNLFGTNRVVNAGIVEEEGHWYIEIGLLSHPTCDVTEAKITAFFPSATKLRFLRNQLPLKATKYNDTVNPLVAGAMIKTKDNDRSRFGSIGWISSVGDVTCVLTAAHCVCDPPYQVSPKIGEVNVFQGIHEKLIGTVTRAVFKTRLGLDILKYS